MLVSTREAAGILAEAGLNREAARRLLLAGLAGQGHRIRGALLFDDEQVRGLLAREHVDPGEAPETVVARVALPSPVKLEDIPMEWRMDAVSRLQIRVSIEREGFFPFVATVSGFVVLGADIVDLAPHTGGRRTALELRAPGPWFGAFRERRLHTGPGSHWLFWPTRGGSSADATVVPRRRRREGTRWLQQ